MTQLFGIVSPIVQYLDDLGVPLAGGLVYSWRANSTTPLATFSDPFGLVPNANPTLLDAEGKAKIFLGPGVYKLDVQTPTGVSIDGFPCDYVASLSVFTGVYPAINYGPSGSGASVQAAINAAQAAGGGTVLLDPVTYALGAVGLTVPGFVSMIGAGANSQFTYSGTGSTITVSGWTQARMAHFRIVTTNDAANGIELGTVTRQSRIEDVQVQGTGALTTTGAGFYFNGVGSSAFNGGVALDTCYSLGYKFGVKFVGANTTVATWTAVDATNCWIVGRAAGYVTGGAGIYFDANTNGGGIMFRGGLMEAWDTAVLHLQGGTGGDILMAIEGYNTFYTVGLSFQGRIEQTHGPVRFQQYSQGVGVNQPDWYKKLLQGGVAPLEESYYGAKHTTYDTSGLPDEIGWYHGASIIGGGTPTKVMAIGLGFPASDFTPANTYFYFAGHKMTWWNAAPTGGAWLQGDVVWNTATVAGGSPGWVCSAAGTPGTWRTMAAVA